MEARQPFPKILIDGVFFQIARTGIARLWSALLREWAASGFGDHVVLLDRDGTAPAIPGIRCRAVASYDHDQTGMDAPLLEDLCERERADLFVSTYYTTPLTTPSLFVVYDMIPEMLGLDLRSTMWREKHYGIYHASAYLAISHNTAFDLGKCFPHIDSRRVTVAYPGVGPNFTPAPAEEAARFQARYHITKPYYLIVGDRVGEGGYKNAVLFFRAFARLPDRERYAVVCTGGAPQLEEQFRALAENAEVHRLDLDDGDLQAAYSGALGLVYPSRYEGFGLPILEAFACGCPVLTCRNSSIPEVAGQAALYTSETDPDELINLLYRLQDPSVRHALIAHGLEQVRKFSWPEMARKVARTCVEVAQRLQHDGLDRPAPLWKALRSHHADLQQRQQRDGQSIRQLQAQLHEAQVRIHGLHNQVLGMESSKFWKLRCYWARSKQGLGELARVCFPARQQSP